MHIRLFKSIIIKHFIKTGLTLADKAPPTNPSAISATWLQSEKVYEEETKAW